MSRTRRVEVYSAITKLDSFAPYFVQSRTLASSDLRALNWFIPAPYIDGACTKGTLIINEGARGGTPAVIISESGLYNAYFYSRPFSYPIPALYFSSSPSFMLGRPCRKYFTLDRPYIFLPASKEESKEARPF
jgi:hypothetical protein